MPVLMDLQGPVLDSRWGDLENQLMTSIHFYPFVP